MVLVLFATSLAVTLRAFAALAEAERIVSQVDDTKHAGYRVAALVREEYIHQAHTIIEGDRSHLEHYKVSASKARESATRLLEMPLAPEEVPAAKEIARLTRVIDEEFHAGILPAVDAGDHERVHALHVRAEHLVNEVVEISERLNHSLEERADLAELREAALRRRAVGTVLGCFALAIVVTVAAWLLIGQSVLLRIEELRKGAQQLAEGDLGARIPIRGADEFAELGATVNEMAASLASHQKKLVQSQRLAVLGQVSAGVAHELNNPLGVILGYLKLLRRNLENGGEASEQLRIVEDEARQCQRIVARLLELGRPGMAQRLPVNLAETAREAIERLLEAGKAGGRKVRAPEVDTAAVTSGDPTALRQVVTNLVLNAIEATPETGSVAVQVRRDDGWLELEVEDNGAGVPAEFSEKVFDPFFTTKPAGTGLGLAISQAIASAHDGVLELRSTPGAGTRAYLRLPAARTSE